VEQGRKGSQVERHSLLLRNIFRMWSLKNTRLNFVKVQTQWQTLKTLWMWSERKKWIQVLVKTLVNASQNIQDDLFRPTYQGDNALQFSDTNLVNMRDSFNPYKQRSTSSGNFLIDAILVASSHGRPSFNQNWLVDPSPHSSLDQSSAIRVFLWKLY